MCYIVSNQILRLKGEEILGQIMRGQMKLGVFDLADEVAVFFVR
jgi:hypothetical protein